MKPPNRTQEVRGLHHRRNWAHLHACCWTQPAAHPPLRGCPLPTCQSLYQTTHAPAPPPLFPPPPPRHLPTCDTGCLSLRVERCLKEYPSSRLFRLAQKGARSLLNCNDRCPNKRTGRQAGARGCDAGEILSHSRCSSPLPPTRVFLLTEGIQCVGGHKVHIRPKDSQLMLIGTLEVWRKPPCSTWQMHQPVPAHMHAGSFFCSHTGHLAPCRTWQMYPSSGPMTCAPTPPTGLRGSAGSSML